MTNAGIADAFDEIADLLEFQGANPFRVRAYRNSARTIRDYPEPFAVILADPERTLTEIDGIGNDLAGKCQQLVETGQLPMLEELRAQVPESVLALLRVPGLGPKKAAALHKQLGIQTLDELKAACEAEQVRALKGFGAKTEQLILDGMPHARSAAAETRLYWAHADQIVQELLAHLRDCPGIERLEPAGSYRRGKETVGDLDLLVVAQNSPAVMDRLAAFPRVSETIVRGGTKMSVRLEQGFQVDLRVVPARSFGAAMQYFTGSKEHNVIVRGRAKQLGLKVNEWGVFRIDGDQENYIAGGTEADVYGALGWPEFPPELREARQEFEWAQSNRLPELITLADIHGDLHMHTTATDGTASILEMVAAARGRGLKYIAITDHSQRVSMAGGLDPERLLRQWEEIDQINTRLGRGFHVLKGIECDILEKGGLDLPDDILAQADWVLASLHYGQHQPRARITARLLQALEHPHVSAMAHPTGRLLNKREPYDVDLDAVMEAARRHHKMLELNAHPARLDLNDVHCATARQMGIPIVINTDAHSPEALRMMRYGILQARRAGLTRHDVANTQTWTQLKKMIAHRP